MRDMTSGSVPRLMLWFTVPLLLTNLLQQLYSMVGSILVGRLVGKDALAAVGTAGSVFNVLMFIVIGLSMGASVLFAEFYGSKAYELLKREFSTALLCGLGFTVCLSAAAFALAGPILRLVNTPESLIPDARTYLRITIAGLCFTLLFNILASALRSVGNAKVPLVVLALSSAVNIGLTFVLVRPMGVAGAALATVIAQALAALLCLIYIQIKVPVLTLKPRDLTIDFSLLRRTVSYSSVAAVQQSVLYVGYLLVQGAVNTLGVDAMAAYNAVSKIDGFALMPGIALGDAVSTFVAQNRGADKPERIRAGLKIGVAMGLIYCAGLAVIMLIFARSFMLWFLLPQETAAVAAGLSYLRVMAFLYSMTAVCNAFQGFFRGLGKMGVTLNATLVQIPIRVVLAYMMVGRMGLNALTLAMGSGWVCMIAYEILEYNRYSHGTFLVRRRKRRKDQGHS